MNLQVSIMKVLASYPSGLTRHVDIKRDLALLATSGQDWANYSKRLGMAFPALDIFSLGFVSRYSFGWRLTAKGLVALQMMEEAAKGVTPSGNTPPVDLPAEGVPIQVSSQPTISLVAKISPKERRFRFTVIEGGKSEAA